jgi:hypothetical protein
MVNLFINYTPIDSKNLKEDNTGLGNLLYQLIFQYITCKKYNIAFNSYYLNKYINKLFEFGLNNYSKTIFRNFNLNENSYIENIDINIIEQNNSIIFDTNIINTIEYVNLHLPNSNILIYNSYLQSIKYIHEYEYDIQNTLSPDDESLNYIYSKYPILLNDNIIKISIHIRLNWGAGISYSDNYINYCVKYFDDIFNDYNINYFIISDNIEYIKNNYNDSRFIYCENNQDYIDIWIMSLCNHNIICHSTFGWWGAYLNKNNNKKVLYPTDIITYFYMIFFKFSDNYDLIKENIFPDSWIGIDINSIIKL